MKVSPNLVARSLALCLSGGLFVFAIARAQLGCARQVTEVTAEDPTAMPTEPSPPTQAPAASPTGAQKPEAAPSGEPEVAPEPTATAAATEVAPDPAWFPASKAGDFRPRSAPAQKQQNANQAPNTTR